MSLNRLKVDIFMKPYRQNYDVKNAVRVKLDRYQIIGKELTIFLLGEGGQFDPPPLLEVFFT